MVLDPDDQPVAKGTLCAANKGFNLHAATRVATNDKAGRERLCRYILRPPFVNGRLSLLPNGNARLELKRPWSDGTTSVELAPLAFIARLAALVPPPRRHTVRYFGVLASHSGLRSQVVPAPATPPGAPAQDKPATRSRYIPWAELLRRTFAIDIVCSKCQSPLRLIALIKTEPIASKFLTAMHLPTEIPKLHPARPPPGAPAWGNGDHEASDDWLN
jgi:hypothetical protein